MDVMKGARERERKGIRLQFLLPYSSRLSYLHTKSSLLMTAVDDYEMLLLFLSSSHSSFSSSRNEWILSVLTRSMRKENLGRLTWENIVALFRISPSWLTRHFCLCKSDKITEEKPRVIARNTISAYA